MKKKIIRIQEIKEKLEDNINLSNLDIDEQFNFKIKSTNSSYKVSNLIYKEYHKTFINITIYMILYSLSKHLENKELKIICSFLNKFIVDETDNIKSCLVNNIKDVIHYVGTSSNKISDKEKQKLFINPYLKNSKFYAIKYSKFHLHQNLKAFLKKIAIGIEIKVENKNIFICIHNIDEKHK